MTCKLENRKSIGKVKYSGIAAQSLRVVNNVSDVSLAHDFLTCLARLLGPADLQERFQFGQ